MRTVVPALLTALLSAVPAVGASATDLTMRVVRSGSGAYVEATMPDFFTSEIVGLLKTGVAVSVRYEVAVHPGGWWGRLLWPLAVFDYGKRLEYSPEANVYVLTTPQGTVRIGGVEAALARFRETDRIPLPEGGWKTEPASYRFRGRMRMETVKLYPPLSLFVGLMDVYNFTTRWVEFR